jgi:H+-transporting ATPase
VTIVIAIVYFLMNKIKWLDELGRKDRSHTNTQVENVSAHLSKIAIMDEKDPWYYPTQQAEGF